MWTAEGSISSDYDLSPDFMNLAEEFYQTSPIHSRQIITVDLTQYLYSNILRKVSNSNFLHKIGVCVCANQGN